MGGWATFRNFPNFPNFPTFPITILTRPGREPQRGKRQGRKPGRGRQERGISISARAAPEANGVARRFGEVIPPPFEPEL